MEHKILITSEKLNQIVAHLAEQINTAYDDIKNVMALVVLDGAKYFAGDLLKQLSLSIDAQYIRASSYLGTTQSCGTVNIETSDDLPQKIRGKNILIIDDIYDTGRTLSNLLKWINAFNPKSIKICVLLEKEIPHNENITIDFLGATIPDAFVIGYGLDFDGQYRDLPYIAELASERIK